MSRTFGAAALIVATLPATAAELARSPELVDASAPAPIGINWSGAYLGVNLGYFSAAIGNLPNAPRGIAAGAQAGYDWRAGPIVFGGEADIQASGAEDRFAAYKFSNPWFGTLRGRAGYAFDNVLIYATAGWAYGAGKLDIPGLSERETHVGWTGGGGIEVGLASHWSARAEYLFICLSDKTYVLSGISSGIEANLIRFGVNYRF